MLLAENVWYSYDGGKRWALRGASIRIERGSIIGVFGPNGAGKTTLLKIAGLLLKPYRGSVKLDGVSVWGSNIVGARRRIVYVHEKPIMIRGTVLENIAYGLRLRGLDWEEAAKRAKEAARTLSIENMLNRSARSLSAGEAQLVAIARAVAVEPEYLLLDEPFAHLDPPRRRLLARLVERLAENGVGIAIATHDTLLVEKLVDRVVYIESGITKELSSVEELYKIA